ncbi:MAG: hypothetical protein HYZ23_05345 [Chloroflexi bacterium]|nr:hypothetical protein [Chloroflexota bacterium]
MFQRTLRGLEVGFILFMLVFIAGHSNPSLTDKIEKVRAYTRQIEFNYISWVADAAIIKLRAASIGAPHMLDRETQKEIVVEYLRLTQTILEKENLLEQMYADPNLTDKELASKPVRDELAEHYARHKELAPLAEAVLQEQVNQILFEIGLTAGGQSVPGVSYHSTPLPYALIVSPRDRIEQLANISIDTDTTVDEMAALESRVDKGLNTSSLVVPIGGIGVYPTMVMRTTNLPWLLSVIAHEWIHNYLTLRPLGMLYSETPELRTMNETTASIAGDEIGLLALKRYYPELAASSTQGSSTALRQVQGSPLRPNPNLILISMNRLSPEAFRFDAFDFRKEMHETRITVDAMLAERKIEEAEIYMEERRQVFLQNGYVLRKINQAYFAFYGAYADAPGGAAGEDPVGPAVRALREQSDSLTDFINTIAWMTSFEQLQEAVR